MLLRFRQHAAGAAGGVVDFDDLAFLVNEIIVGEEKVDHELDDLARREVIARLLVCLLVEPTDEVLEDVAHRDVGDGVRVQINCSDLLDDFKEAVGLLQLLNLVGEIELLDDLPRARGEAGDEFREVGRELVRVAEELVEGEVAGFVESQFVLPVDHLLDGRGVIFALGLQLLVLGDDLILGLSQDAIQPAQHRERDHHSAILRRPVRATQEIGDVPDDITVFFEGFEVFHGWVGLGHEAAAADVDEQAAVRFDELLRLHKHFPEMGFKLAESGVVRGHSAD